MATFCWHRIFDVELVVFMLLYMSHAVRGADTKTIEIPSATVNQSVTLPCHTGLHVAVDWWYQVAQTDTVQQVCMNGEVANTFRKGFYINSSNPGDYNLVLRNAKLSDAGFYTCVEDAGLSTRHVMYLRVIPDVANNTATIPLITTVAAVVVYSSDDDDLRAPTSEGLGRTSLPDITFAGETTSADLVADPFPTVTTYVVVGVIIVVVAIVIVLVFTVVCVLWRRQLLHQRVPSPNKKTETEPLTGDTTYRRIPELLDTIETGVQVSSIAHLDGKLFVAGEPFTAITVYVASHPFTELNQFRLERVNGFVGMVAWDSQKSLIVADYKTPAVFKVSPVNGKPAENWLSSASTDVRARRKEPEHSEIQPCLLSIANDQLVVTSLDHTIRYLNKFGCQVRCISIDPSADLYYSTVSPIDGDIITFIANESQVVANKTRKHVFRTRSYFAFDSEGRAFSIANNKNDICLRNVDLRIERIFIDGKSAGIYRPSCICYIESSGLLLIGQSAAKSVKIYNVLEKCSHRGGDQAI